MSTTQNNQRTVSSTPSLPPDTRTNIEKIIDANAGRSWADICAAETSPQDQNLALADEFNPSKTLAALMAADDEPSSTQRPAPQEDGVQLSEGSLRILSKAQGSDGLTDAERDRLDRAEHRADLERAMELALKNTAAVSEIVSTIPSDEETAVKGSQLIREFFNNGRRDFSADERAAMELAMDSATREYTLSDDPQANERHRRQQIAELQVVAVAIADNTATRAQRIRWSRFNTSRLLHLLRTTRWADLPMDLVRNF